MALLKRAFPGPENQSRSHMMKAKARNQSDDHAIEYSGHEKTKSRRKSIGSRGSSKSAMAVPRSAACHLGDEQRAEHEHEDTDAEGGDQPAAFDALVRCTHRVLELFRAV